MAIGKGVVVVGVLSMIVKVVVVIMAEASKGSESPFAEADIRVRVKRWKWEKGQKCATEREEVTHDGGHLIIGGQEYRERGSEKVGNKNKATDD